MTVCESIKHFNKVAVVFFMTDDLKILDEVFPFSHIDWDGTPIYKVKPGQIEQAVDKLDKIWQQWVLEKLKKEFGAK